MSKSQGVTSKLRCAQVDSSVKWKTSEWCIGAGPLPTRTLSHASFTPLWQLRPSFTSPFLLSDVCTNKITGHPGNQEDSRWQENRGIYISYISIYRRSHLGDLWCFLLALLFCSTSYKKRETIRQNWGSSIYYSTMSSNIGEQLFPGYSFPLQLNSLKYICDLVKFQLSLLHLQRNVEIAEWILKTHTPDSSTLLSRHKQLRHDLYLPHPCQGS